MEIVRVTSSYIQQEREKISLLVVNFTTTAELTGCAAIQSASGQNEPSSRFSTRCRLAERSSSRASGAGRP